MGPPVKWQPQSLRCRTPVRERSAVRKRKIWRAILRADLAIFDVSRGNPNVAFELGLAVVQNKSCITILQTGEPTPLGSAHLGYAERAEYTSAAVLKEMLAKLLASKSTATRKMKIGLHVAELEARQSRHRSSVVELSIRNPARPAPASAGRCVSAEQGNTHDVQRR